MFSTAAAAGSRVYLQFSLLHWLCVCNDIEEGRREQEGGEQLAAWSPPPTIAFLPLLVQLQEQALLQLCVRRAWLERMKKLHSAAEGEEKKKTVFFLLP